jgi:hypothetical protein
MADDGVGDFIQPVHAVEHHGGCDGLVVLLVNFVHIDHHHKREDCDERPVEVGCAAHGFLRKIRKRLESVVSKEHGTSTSLIFFCCKQ